MQKEPAKWPSFYPDLEVEVFAPRFYRRSSDRNRNDQYSQMIVDSKHKDLSDYFFTRMVNIFRQLPFKPDIITVIPSSKIGEFSPTLLALGQKLANKFGIVNANLLERVKEGKKNTNCSHCEERFENTNGSFKVNGILNGEKIVLLDDTRATGMTFLEGAKMLMPIGASKVVGMCLGINKRKKEGRNTAR